MAVSIPMDPNGIVEMPTFVLASRTGSKLGVIPTIGLTFRNNFTDSYECVFKVYKYIDGIRQPLWDEIKDFKLLWCRDWDKWFDITVSLDETNEDVKNITAVSLAKSELSQIYVYGLECNTEDDIARDDYVDSVLYNEENEDASLLHRIFKSAPHYSIKHVDASIASIEKIFSFDKKDIEGCLNEIDQEIHCIHIDDISTNEDGTINRAVSFYDLESLCMDCGFRGEFRDVCPECGKNNVQNGYGEDTGIILSTECLSESIGYSVDAGSVKNCFKLEAGDDLMTATIINANPNGSSYIWHLTEETKSDMPKELVDRLDKYDALYEEYNTTHEIVADSNLVGKYNSLITKYKSEDLEISSIPTTIVGFPNLINAIYDCEDFELYLDTYMMPHLEWPDTTAEEQASLLTVDLLSPVAVKNVSATTEATANSAVLLYAKNFVDHRYQIKIKSSEYANGTWKGVFTISSYTDEEDISDTSTLSISLNDSVEEYVSQQLDKVLNNENGDQPMGISELFELEIDDFKEQLTLHCATNLALYKDMCQKCIDILIEQNVGNKELWADENKDLYTEMYLPYCEKLNAIDSELSLRQSEITDVTNVNRALCELRDEIRDTLNIQNYLGKNLWPILMFYRREGTYSNSNYISDGSNNAKLLKDALEFIEKAQKELYRSANLQHSITSTLKNLLVIKEFQKLTDKFEVANWIRIIVDEKPFLLRLLEYEIQFDNLSTINVVFSDVEKVVTGYSDIEQLLSQAGSMATSYDYVEHQASQGAETNKVVADWFKNGLDSTNVKIIGGADNQAQTWDSHGMLFRKYDPTLDSYDDKQLKIINSTMAITSDNWESTETAVGYFLYRDPLTNELKEGYGVNGSVVIGSLILGERLGIHNQSSSMTFNNNGLTVTNDVNTFSVNPNNADSLMSVTKKNGDTILSFNRSGDLSISGTIEATNGKIGDFYIESDGRLRAGEYESGNVCVFQEPRDSRKYSIVVGYASNISENNWNNCGFRVTKDGKLYAKDAVVENSLFLYDTVNKKNIEALRANGGIYFPSVCYFSSDVRFNENTIFQGVNTFKSDINLEDHKIMCGYKNEFTSLNYYRNDSDNSFLFIGNHESQQSCTTVLRGSTVRIYSNQPKTDGSEGRNEGAVYLGSTGAIAVSSDENIKNIYEIDKRYEDFFMRLKPVLYTYKDIGHRKHIGYGARQVEQALIDSDISLEDFAGILIDNDVTITADESRVGKEVHYDELYSLRYEEFGALYALMLQKALRRIEELEKLHDIAK